MRTELSIGNTTWLALFLCCLVLFLSALLFGIEVVVYCVKNCTVLPLSFCVLKGSFVILILENSYVYLF